MISVNFNSSSHFPTFETSYSVHIGIASSRLLVGNIYNAINQVAQETSVDHCFILAVVMQESGGCVRAPTINYGVRNLGLMQDHDGDGTCNSDILLYMVQNPCPSDQITLMIQEGTAGTSSGDGLANCINESGASDASAFYKAARIYNSGSIVQRASVRSLDPASQTVSTFPSEEWVTSAVRFSDNAT